MRLRSVQGPAFVVFSLFVMAVLTYLLYKQQHP